jgi:hypothetical protein
MLGHHYSLMLLDGEDEGTDMMLPISTALKHISANLGTPRKGGSLRREYAWQALELEVNGRGR